MSIDTKQVKQQEYREKTYLIKSFAELSKTYNKVSAQQITTILHKYCPPLFPLWLALPHQMIVSLTSDLFAPRDPLNMTTMTRHHT